MNPIDLVTITATFPGMKRALTFNFTAEAESLSTEAQVTALARAIFGPGVGLTVEQVDDLTWMVTAC